jgi:hypothetical protein
MTKIAVGDVVEIKTQRGFAYALYTHRDPTFGALLRVWNQTHAEPLVDFEHLASQPLSWSAFFPLSAAVKQKVVRVAGSVVVPPDLAAFPLFRAGMPDPGTRRVSNWWLWDGKREWPVGELTSEQRKLPIRQTINDTLLIERIERAWTSEADPR